MVRKLMTRSSPGYNVLKKRCMACVRPAFTTIDLLLFKAAFKVLRPRSFPQRKMHATCMLHDTFGIFRLGLPPMALSTRVKSIDVIQLDSQR